jgi:cell division septation protein DedD
VIQALVTRSRDRAHRLRERLRGRGLQAVVSEGSVGGEVIYRVRVGRYRDRAVADLVARRIREAEDLDPWVLKEAD